MYSLFIFQFDSPIVNVWTLMGSSLNWIDLFKPAEITNKKDNPIQPALYIGIHDHQVITARFFYCIVIEEIIRKGPYSQIDEFERRTLSCNKFHFKSNSSKHGENRD